MNALENKVWRSKDYDFPVQPTGEERTAPDGRVYAKVKAPDGAESFVPKDEIVDVVHGANGQDDPDFEQSPGQPSSNRQDDAAPDGGAHIALTLASLANDRVWVAWQTEDREDGKPTKVPYAPNGQKAMANKPSTWGTRAQAEALVPSLPKPYGIAGIGLEFTNDGNGRSIGGIDLNSCRNPQTGVIEPWATEVIKRFNTYTEVSPSGTGVKLFFAYTTDELPTLRIAMGGSKYCKQFKRGNGDHPPAIEVHLGNRYFAVTDQHLAGTSTEFRHVPLETLLWVLKEAGPAFAGPVPTKHRAATAKITVAPPKPFARRRRLSAPANPMKKCAKRCATILN